MNYVTTIWLFVLVIIVGAYFWFVEADIETNTGYDSPRQSLQEPQDQRIFEGQDTIPIDEVTQIIIRKPAGQGNAWVLTKNKNGWQQTQPVNFPLNEHSVREIIENFATLRYSQRLTSASPGTPGKSNTTKLPSMESVSLEPGEAEITALWGKEPTQSKTVVLGSKAVGGRGYVRVHGEDKHFYVVNDTLHRNVVEAKLSQWRKRTLEAPTRGQANRVTLDHSWTRTIHRRHPNRWRLVLYFKTTWRSSRR